MTNSKARILQGKIAFFMNFSGVLPQEIVEKHFPKEGDLQDFLAVELPEIKERHKKEKAPYNNVEWDTQVLAKAYDIVGYSDLFEEEALTEILAEFIKANTPTKLTSLYKKEKKKA